MNLIYELLGIVFIFLGIVGSFLPILPGPLTSWAGLLLLHQSDRIEENTSFLGITFAIALSVFLIDYIIPAIGTKKFGGSKKGIIGSTIGLLIGLIFFGPFGLIIGPFTGAFIGELINKTPRKMALKAAFGSFIGFLGGVFLKFSVSLIFAFRFAQIYLEALA